MKECYWCMNEGKDVYVNTKQFCSKKCANDYIKSMEERIKNGY